MKNFTDKENLKIYGQIVEDFVNSQDSDEAYLSIIQGIPKAFNFSSDFTEKALKHFPSLKRIASNLNENLSEKEMELLKLYPKYYGYRGLIAAQIHRLMLDFEGYDHEKGKFVVFSEIDPEGKDIYIDINFDEKNKRKFLEQFEKYKPSESLFKLWQKDNQELLETVKKYRELSLKINELSKAISEVGHSKFKKIYECKCIEGHDKIMFLQKTLQIILKKIMKRKSLNKSIYINDILEIYNDRYKKYLVIDSDDTFSYQTRFPEEEKYIRSFDIIEENEERLASGEFEGDKSWERYWKSNPNDQIKARHLNMYHYDFIFIFIEFMRLSNQKNLANICNMCSKFFISQKDDSRIKFCPSCSPKSKMSREKKNELQRKWREKQKQKKLAIQREARIENLMKRTGYSKEEVIEIIEADESMM